MKLGIPDRKLDMKIGEIVDRIAADMHLVVHRKRFGEMRCLDKRCNAALDRDVASQIIGGPLSDPDRIGSNPATGRSVAMIGMSSFSFSFL